MAKIKVIYIDYRYKCKPLERLAIGAAIEASKLKNDFIDLDRLAVELKRYSKGLRHKLYYSADDKGIKAENIDNNLRASLLDYVPQWAA